MTDITIGADISKDHIDLQSLPDGQTLEVANDRKGFAAIVRWIGTKDVERIVHAGPRCLPLQPGSQRQIRPTQNRRKSAKGRHNRDHA